MAPCHWLRPSVLQIAPGRASHPLPPRSLSLAMSSPPSSASSSDATECAPSVIVAATEEDATLAAGAASALALSSDAPAAAPAAAPVAAASTAAAAVAPIDPGAVFALLASRYPTLLALVDRSSAWKESDVEERLEWWKQRKISLPSWIAPFFLEMEAKATESVHMRTSLHAHERSRACVSDVASHIVSVRFARSSVGAGAIWSSAARIVWPVCIRSPRCGDKLVVCARASTTLAAGATTRPVAPRRSRAPTSAGASSADQRPMEHSSNERPWMQIQPRRQRRRPRQQRPPQRQPQRQSQQRPKPATSKRRASQRSLAEPPLVAP